MRERLHNDKIDGFQSRRNLLKNDKSIDKLTAEFIIEFQKNGGKVAFRQLEDWKKRRCMLDN
jgi:hypothetical protein